MLRLVMVTRLLMSNGMWALLDQENIKSFCDMQTIIRHDHYLSLSTKKRFYASWKIQTPPSHSITSGTPLPTQSNVVTAIVTRMITVILGCFATRQIILTN